MPAAILVTKLYIPRSRQRVVLRPRLVQRLNEGLAAGNKLTLVSAPAGFGKTTLVSEWVAGCGRHLVRWPDLARRAGISRSEQDHVGVAFAALATVAELGTGAS